MDERTKQTLVLGREHYSKREFDKAEPLLREVLEHEDRFADIHDMLGVIAHSRGNFIAAEKHFERAITINPAYTEAALNLAVTYNDRGKYEKAREVYSRIQGAPSGLKSGLDPFARGKIANMHADVGQAYDQFIYQFAGAPQAAAFVTGVQALAGRCGSFTATANGQSGTFSLRTAAGTTVGGHPATELLETGTLGGSKLKLDTLLCASGVDVFAASDVGVGGNAAPTQVARETIIYRLMQRQAAAAVLG